MNADEAALLGFLREELSRRLREGAALCERALASAELERAVESYARELGVEFSAVHSYGERPNFIQDEAAERVFFKLKDLAAEGRARLGGGPLAWARLAPPLTEREKGPDRVAHFLTSSSRSRAAKLRRWTRTRIAAGPR